jgi:protein gp37
MGDQTGIAWTEATWNPVVGCTHISPGCDHCYAAREASGRLRGIPVYSGLAEGGRFTGEVRILPERLDQPLRWQRPRLIFVNSMSDLFHRGIPAEFVGQLFDVMARTPRHTYQVLTKRPQLVAYILGPNGCGFYASEDPDLPCPQPNVWLGTSIESDRYTFRADHLRATPAAVRWLSLEPLIAPVPSLDLAGIGWVVVGGESGPGARPMDLGWARDIRDRCVAAGVAFFMKQLGAVVARDNGMSDRAGHTLAEFPEDLRIQDYPAAPAPGQLFAP